MTIFEIISIVCVLIAVIGIVILLCGTYKEIKIIDNTPKIYFYENMIDIEIEQMSEEDIEKLAHASFAWQPDITNTRLRMYGSEGMLWGIVADIKETYPNYDVVLVA